MSTSNVRFPRRAYTAATLIDVVVFPQPPFWLTIENVRKKILSGFKKEATFLYRNRPLFFLSRRPSNLPPSYFKKS
jgi:hypothetical protein